MISSEKMGLLLRTLRKESGCKQEEIAHILNLSRQAYGHYESGTRLPSLDYFYKLTEHFGFTMDELVRISNSPDLDTLLSEKDEFTYEETAQNILREQRAAYGRAYPSGTNYLLTPSEELLLQRYRALSDHSRDVLKEISQTLELRNN